MAGNHTAVRSERQDLFEDQLRASDTRSVRRASGLVLARHSGSILLDDSDEHPTCIAEGTPRCWDMQ